MVNLASVFDLELLQRVISKNTNYMLANCSFYSLRWIQTFDFVIRVQAIENVKSKTLRRALVRMEGRTLERVIVSDKENACVSTSENVCAVKIVHFVGR